MKNTKKKHNLNNIIAWISIFILLALVTAIIFNYIDTTQATAIFIAEILIAVSFMLIMLLDAIQQELYDIKNSLDNLYDPKQINGLRSTVDKRHIENLLHDLEKTINDTYNGGKINEENKY